jgi:hypothetical protein
VELLSGQHRLRIEPRAQGDVSAETAFGLDALDLLPP